MRELSRTRCALVLLAAGLVLAAGPSGLLGNEERMPQGRAAAQTPSAVEVLGFATMQDGKTLGEAHREALLDARRNALIQSHVSVDLETRLQDMRLLETVLRTRSTGRVEKIHVLEAGLMKDTVPPVYRVRVRAIVHPLSVLPAATQSDYGRPDQWQPVVALKLTSDLAPDRQAGFRSSLVRAMGWCGVEVVQADEPRPALVTEVEVLGDPNGKGKALNVHWQMGLGTPADPGRPPAFAPVRGHWHNAEGADPWSLSWERVGVLMAQDAIRLWTAPRHSTVVVRNCNDAHVRSLRHAFGPEVEVRVEQAAGARRLTAELPLAGDPLQALEPTLRKAELAGELKPVETSLTRIVFEFPPPEEPPADAPPD